MKISISIEEAKYIADQLFTRVKSARERDIRGQIDKLKSFQVKKGWFSKELVRKFTDDEIEKIMNDEMEVPWDLCHIFTRSSIGKWYQPTETVAKNLSWAADTVSLSELNNGFIVLDSEDIDIIQTCGVSINPIRSSLSKISTQVGNL